MQMVNITLISRCKTTWQFGKSEWDDERRAAIFRQFWSKVQRADADSCWLWTGSIASHGYGVFSVGRDRIRAHRFAWMTSRGPVPQGQDVCHSCDQPSCVNPSHLFVASHHDNLLDSVRKGRKRVFGRQKLNAAAVLDIRSRAAAGELHRSIAADHGIRRHSVSGIVHRKSWAHVA